MQVAQPIESLYQFRAVHRTVSQWDIYTGAYDLHQKQVTLAAIDTYIDFLRAEDEKGFWAYHERLGARNPDLMVNVWSLVYTQYGLDEETAVIDDIGELVF